MKRPYFIVNPSAGSGKCLQKFHQVAKRLDALAVPYVTAFSEYPDHAATLVPMAIEAGCDCVVAVGGDGIVRQIGQALVGTCLPLGILPLGTGNDFIKSLDIPASPDAAMDLILHGKARPIDAVAANDKIFVNVAGIGFDVSVLVYTERYKKWFHGSFSYILGVLHALIDPCSRPMRITTPDRVFEKEALLIGIGNGMCIGGGMKITPQADPADGLLDVCIVNRVSRRRFLLCLPKFMRGAHIGLDIIEYFKTTELTVECTPGTAVQLDGEIIEETPVTFRILPGVLSVFCPAAPASKQKKEALRAAD